MKYDSTSETLKHIKRVNELLTDVAIEILLMETQIRLL